MSLWSRLYRGETQFDFIRDRKRYFTLSLALIVVSLLSLAFRQLEGSVDFTGGTIIEAENRSGAEVANFRDALAGLGQSGARVQSIDAGRSIKVQTETLPGGEQDALVAVVADVAGVSFDETNVDAVGPTFGSDITNSSIRALIFFLIAVGIFISFRFEWKNGRGGLGGSVPRSHNHGRDLLGGWLRGDAGDCHRHSDHPRLQPL